MKFLLFFTLFSLACGSLTTDEETRLRECSELLFDGKIAHEEAIRILQTSLDILRSDRGSRRRSSSWDEPATRLIRMMTDSDDERPAISHDDADDEDFVLDQDSSRPARHVSRKTMQLIVRMLDEKRRSNL